uniref:Uncharacterized protein n=1 Tax=Oryza nivara TaxID=4536 RepID=A0A0E0GA25_ORYNI
MARTTAGDGSGVIQAEEDPRGDHVLGECADKNQQMPGGRRGGFLGEARPAIRRVPALQPRATMSLAAAAAASPASRRRRHARRRTQRNNRISEPINGQ